MRNSKIVAYSGLGMVFVGVVIFATSPSFIPPMVSFFNLPFIIIGLVVLYKGSTDSIRENRGLPSQKFSLLRVIGIGTLTFIIGSSAIIWFFWYIFTHVLFPGS